jgi:hypothetical protein
VTYFFVLPVFVLAMLSLSAATIVCAAVPLFAFEIDARPLGRRLASVLDRIDGVSAVHRRRWWSGSPDVHVRFQYCGREYLVWEPHGDSSRWWIGPDDDTAEHVSLADVERAVAALGEL